MLELEKKLTYSASEYIQKLMAEDLACLAPLNLLGKPVGWDFYPKSGEIVGYEVLVNEKDGSFIVKLNSVKKCAKGAHLIEKVGPASQIRFGNQVGRSDVFNFISIKNTLTKKRIALIVKK